MEARASLVPDTAEKYARTQSIVSLGGLQHSHSFYSEDDEVINEMAEKVLTDGTKVCKYWYLKKDDKSNHNC